MQMLQWLRTRQRHVKREEGDGRDVVPYGAQLIVQSAVDVRRWVDVDAQGETLTERVLETVACAPERRRGRVVMRCAAHHRRSVHECQRQQLYTYTFHR